MQYISHYESHIGKMLIAADDIGLTGLWFEGQKYYCAGLDSRSKEEEVPALRQAREWLDIYFSREKPDFEPPLHFIGTEFQKEVWEILRNIPYGCTTTYGEIAKQIAAAHGLKRMSAQAVGGAVGHNKISIIVPCHRVTGADGSLTGYAGGMDRKSFLLRLENAYRKEFFIPKISKAP